MGMRTNTPATMHVVVMVNFVAPNAVAVFQELSRRVGRLSVLSSVAMEPNRDWQAEWGDLNAIVQRTWTIERTSTHPSGYREPNYIHIPLDTFGQLRRLKPDAIVSMELGARSMLARTYAALVRRPVPVVMGVCVSRRSEAGRGKVREFVRRRLLRDADWVTFNGPDCRELLISLGADPAAMSPYDYACDPDKPYLGDRDRGFDPASLRLLTIGQLSARKGVLEAKDQLVEWAAQNPDRHVHWSVIGGGPLIDEMNRPHGSPNLVVDCVGHRDADELRVAYRDHDALLLPTLGDEWGLVVDEALFSGLPVIGSVHSQAVTTLIRAGENGWLFDPERSGSLAKALDPLRELSAERWSCLSESARASVTDRTPTAAAEQLVAAVASAELRVRGGRGE